MIKSCYFCLEREADFRKYICSQCNSRIEEFHIKLNRESNHLDKVYISLAYNRFLKDLIASYKFSGHKYLYRPLAYYLLKTMKIYRLDDFDYIAYLPSHINRELRRGFNQVQLLAKELSKKTQIPLLKGLKKTRSNKDQIELRRSDRLENVKGVFTYKSRISLEGKKILLLDDILSTGASIEELASLIKEEGALSVTGLILASNAPYSD